MASAKKISASAMTEPVVDEFAAVDNSPVVETATAEFSAASDAVEAEADKAAAAMPEVAKMIEAPMETIAEAQGKVRTMVESGIVETRSKYTQMKSAADEAATAFEASYATIKSGALQLNTKALEALQAGAEAHFAFVKSAFSVKSPSDLVTLQTEFARKQIEMMTAHAKAMGELAQKVATDTVEPIKAQVAKTFRLPR
jgi:phasin